MWSHRLDYSDRTGAILYGYSLFGEKAFQQKEKKTDYFSCDWCYKGQHQVKARNVTVTRRLPQTESV